MNILLEKLFAPRHLEYLLINKNLIIVQTSDTVKRLADRPNEVKLGNDVRLSFPELIGIEALLAAIYQKQQDSFEIKGIARSLKPNPLYIDLCISNFENHLILLVEDVTEKMVAKQAIIQQANAMDLLLSELAGCKDYLNNVINCLGDALLITTASGQIRAVNQITQDLLGYSESELLNQPISLIIDHPSLLFRPGKQEFLEYFKLDCRTKIGKKVILEFRRSTIQTEVEELPIFIYLGRAIHNETLEERKSEDLQKEQKISNLKSRFTFTASHKLRTPLNIILSSTVLLESRSNNLLDGENRSLLKYIKNAAQEMSDLLEEILVASQFNAEKLEFDPVLINLKSVCSQLVQQANLTFGQQRIVLVGGNLNQSVAVDQKLLEQILTHLLFNAIKYSLQEELVYVELYYSSQKDVAIVEVRDQGIGIPLEEQKQIFEMFYRASNVSHISGAGLGLAMVKKAVELHGGSLEVESQVGVGTVIRVLLPIDHQAESN